MSEKLSNDMLHDNLGNMLAERVRQPLEWNEPQVFDLSYDGDRSELQQVIETGAIDSVYDRITEIANDLYELHNPDKKNDFENREKFKQEIQSQDTRYGKWVLFPWSKELIHFPDKEDHRALRTSRNRNLITNEEQDKLYDSTVAVFGLSVGSNVVERLVGSGIGGTIIMGDPDHIEPSNLNRISGGFSEVGSKKIDRMARDISEVDPYIKQVHFHEGVTKGNLDTLAELQPDIIFDEVDDLPMKAAIRKFAQEQGIPLVMATDLGDRSLVDIERFDDGKTQPFNGRIKSEAFTKLHDGTLTPEERSKFMAKIVGLRHVTTRMLESVMEVEKTLPGLPQLGSTAAMGGSLAAIAAREILLGRELPSGRYVCSPKEILRLKPQVSLPVGLKTLMKFAKASKQ